VGEHVVTSMSELASRMAGVHGQAFRSRIMEERWHRGRNATREYKNLLGRIVKPGTRILHGGCGWDKHEVSRPFKGHCKVVGIDLDSRVQSMFHSPFCLASLSAIPFQNNSFDLICLEYVLEHVDNPGSAFREMARVLQPGGRVLILTPNLYSYKTLAAYLTPHKFHNRMGHLRYGPGHEVDMYPTLYRCNTPRRIKRLAEENDLQVRMIHFVTNGPTWFEKLPVLFEMFHLFHLAIERWEFVRQLRCALIVEIQKGETSPCTSAGEIPM